jgi:hypothetical protein
MRAIRSLFVALLLAMLAGCASDVSVGTAYDPLTVFPRKGGFAWVEGAGLIPAELAHLELAELLPPAVDAAMQRRGWRKVAVEEADLLVFYEVGVNTIVEVASPGSSSSRSRALGSLTVTLLDPKSRRHLWVGFIRAQINPSVSREERRARLDSVLRDLFKEFPP